MTLNVMVVVGPDDETAECEVSRNRDGEDFKVVRLDTEADITDKLSLKVIESLEEQLQDAEDWAKQDGNE